MERGAKKKLSELPSKHWYLLLLSPGRVLVRCAGAPVRGRIEVARVACLVPPEVL